MSQRLIENISKNTGYLRSTHLYHPRRDAIRASGFSSMRFSENLSNFRFTESKRDIVISLNIHVSQSVSALSKCGYLPNMVIIRPDPMCHTIKNELPA